MENESALADPEYEDDHAADYMSEAIRDYNEQQSRERYERMPALCKKCRWLDWYMVEGCSHGRWPMREQVAVRDRDGQYWNISLSSALSARETCALYARDLGYWRPRWLWQIVLDVQYLLWNRRTRGEPGKFSAPPHGWQGDVDGDDDWFSLYDGGGWYRDPSDDDDDFGEEDDL